MKAGCERESAGRRASTNFEFASLPGDADSYGAYWENCSRFWKIAMLITTSLVSSDQVNGGGISSQALKTLVESMHEPRCDEHNIQLVPRLFRDNIARREPEIRKHREGPATVRKWKIRV